MKHRLIDERDTVAEDEATQFRVAFAHPGNYVQMHDVESDDVRDVLRWAEEFNKSSETPACQGELRPVVHSKSASAGRDQDQQP